MSNGVRDQMRSLWSQFSRAAFSFILLSAMLLGPARLVWAAEFDQRVAISFASVLLIEQLSDAEILAGEDPDDVNGDGISGRAHRSFSLFSMEAELGRFGWKATKPRLEDQIIESLTNDLDAAGKAADPEIIASIAEQVRRASRLELLTFELKRRDLPEAFDRVGCTSCHRWNGGLMSNLLLHDLGDALADARPEGFASAREWRTAPLVGLANRSCFLHDCRATSLKQAILLHAGEGENSAQAFAALEESVQQQMLSFLLLP